MQFVKKSVAKTSDLECVIVNTQRKRLNMQDDERRSRSEDIKMGGHPLHLNVAEVSSS
jgi:hypothetical protein